MRNAKEAKGAKKAKGAERHAENTETRSHGATEVGFDVSRSNAGPFYPLLRASVALCLCVFLGGLAACGGEQGPKPEATKQTAPQKPAEDYMARLVENRWDDLQAFDAEEFSRQVVRWYSTAPDALDEDLFVPLHDALVRLKPEPEALLPVLATRPPDLTLDDAEVYNRDSMTRTVVVHMLNRICIENPPPAEMKARLFEVAMRGCINFTFDPLYGDGPTQTGKLMGKYLSEAPVLPEASAALRNNEERLMARWRKRVSDSASSTTFGILIRHLGSDGAALVFKEWKGLSEEERIDILERVRKMDEVRRAVLAPAVDALLDPSFSVRDSAFKALEAHGAPLGELDASARERDIDRAQPALLRWTAETDS